MGGRAGPAPAIAIRMIDPAATVARQMSEALWAEIQARYGFCAPDPFDPCMFGSARGGFWVAFDDGVPVGSVALAPLGQSRAELDMMYVASTHRRMGIADALLRALEARARSVGTAEIMLRAGDPQPEALAFYRAAGFVEAERFGRWLHDDTALCFRKVLGPHDSR